MNAPVATTLMAIGGAMDVKGPGKVLREFYQLSGGELARIVILPTASNRPEAGEEVLEALLRLGLEHEALILPVRSREAGQDPALCAPVEQATGIFIGGGNQLRLTSLLGGTRLEAVLLEAYRRGAVVSGSSAGAAVLSRIMPAYGKPGPTPRVGMAQFVSGFGFTDQIIFDQHFRQRDRLGRLIYAIANHPRVLGAGVDENTAAVLQTQPDGTGCLHVVGQNAVTVVDGREMTHTDVADLEEGQSVAVSGLKVHVLTHGCWFDLATGQTYIPEKSLPVE